MDDDCAFIKQATIYWKGVPEPSVLTFEVPTPWRLPWNQGLNGKFWSLVIGNQTHYIDLGSVRHLVLVFAAPGSRPDETFPEEARDL